MLCFDYFHSLISQLLLESHVISKWRHKNNNVLKVAQLDNPKELCLKPTRFDFRAKEDICTHKAELDRLMHSEPTK